MKYNEIEKMLNNMPNKKAPEGVWERIEGTLAAKDANLGILHIFTPSPRLAFALASFLIILTVTVSMVGIKVHKDNVHEDVNQYLYEMISYINTDASWIDMSEGF